MDQQFKESKYPKILIDEDRNLPNPDGSVTLTFEQYYDLLHHSHEGSSESASVEIEELKNNVVSLQSTITTLNTTIDEIKSQIEELKTNSFTIGDWDAEQDGDQGPDDSNNY